jgi:glutaconyl-CoA/methylmalonyl-CoA decarboxylase subunit delta
MILLQQGTPGITGDDIILTIIGMGVVFASLVVLWLLFDSLPKVLDKVSSLTEKKNKTEAATPLKQDISGEVNAAIGAAIFLYLDELHDEETSDLTIQRISRSYSPWSSKIYSVFNLRKIRQ